VITSYPLLRLDAERLCREEFEALVLDEAQHIKNPESQAAQAAFRLRARRRFVLTGTPVENSVRDVWSLLHFLMPGYLGTKSDFRERYELPISQEPGCAEHKRLIQRLAPFLLRRTKKAVAPELPDKIEQVVWCDLSAEQRETYSKLVDLSRREVGKAEALLRGALAEGEVGGGEGGFAGGDAVGRLAEAFGQLGLVGGEQGEAGGVGAGGLLALVCEAGEVAGGELAGEGAGLGGEGGGVGGADEDELDGEGAQARGGPGAGVLFDGDVEVAAAKAEGADAGAAGVVGAADPGA
jgi:hypothetical protein